MWVIANDCEKPKQKVIVCVEDGSNEDSIIQELDKRFWELFEYDPEGYDWEMLGKYNLYNFEVK
tara:strand:- start:435 stop:626 length:192 start_codon:yes stop_codon:yes gene_type:complete